MKAGIILVVLTWGFLFAMALSAPHRPVWFGGAHGLEDRALSRSGAMSAQEGVIPVAFPPESGPSLSRTVSEGNRTVAPGQRDSHLQLTQAGPLAQDCRQLSTDAVSTVSRPDIYQWRDAEGRLHLSDTSPAEIDATLYDGALPTVREYFALNIDYQELQRVPHLSSRLRSRLNQVYAELSKLVGEERLRKVTLNLKIFPDRERYLASARQVHPDPNGTAGFYTAVNNQAVTYIHADHDRTLEVSVHEGLHVIAAGLFGIGTMPIWLNEGLAEYFENIEVKAQYATVGINAGSLNRAQSLVQQGYPRSILDLLEMDRDSWDQHPEAHYALSWALIFFLFDSGQGRDALSALLREKAARYCEEVNMRYWLETTYPAGERGLERDFREWLEQAESPVPHRY